MLTPGTYRYEIRRGGDLIALEETTFAEGRLKGERRSPDGQNQFTVEAELDAESQVRRVQLRYSRGLFSRSAVYDAVDDALRGSISGLTGRNEVMVKMGRFREIDAGITLFRALIIAHIAHRGQTRWTGRVAVIDSGTLVAASTKHTCRRGAVAGQWLYETRMGEADTLAIDPAGRIISGRDSAGAELRLAEFRPC